MDARSESQPQRNATTVERTSDREVAVTRTVNGPARLVFEAWTRAELFQQWWVPKSVPIVLLSCEVDARVGGGYRLVFDVGDGQTVAFFGTYLEVTPPSRLAWTNDEAAEPFVSTVTFTEHDGKTRIVMTERYPTKEALDAAVESGSLAGNSETFDQLEHFLASSRD